MRFVLLLFAALVVAQTAAPAQTSPEKFPLVQNERFVRDLHDKNVVDILDLYTPKAVLVDPSGKSFKGTNEIRELYEKMTNSYDSDIHLRRTHFERASRVVIEHGDYTETLRSRTDGAEQNIRGTYVFLHEKQPDGTWLIAHQKWTKASLH